MQDCPKTAQSSPNHPAKRVKQIKQTICLLPLLALSSAQAGTLIVQDYDYFSTASSFSDGMISVYDGAAKWEGVTDSSGSTANSGTFGDGTVLDYRFVGVDRSEQELIEHANGGGAYLTSELSVGTYGASGGANSGLDMWWDTDPDDGGVWASTPDSNGLTDDHVAGGSQITGTVDVSGLASAQIYFVYGSYKNAATVTLTDADDNVLGVLSLPNDGPDNDRLVIQEVTIDNSDSSYDTINFAYTASNNAGRGRFSGVIVDGVVPEPGSLALLGLGGLLIARRRRG